MRVISGYARGYSLKAPPGRLTRPTADRVREAIFNVIGPAIAGKTFLDLYAGSGAVGIEALSRGAKEVVFVEKNPRVAQVLRSNVKAIGAGEEAKVMVVDAERACRKLHGRQFDIVFVDPPYDSGLLSIALKSVAQAGIMAREGILIAEASKREEFPRAQGQLVLVRKDRYGDTVVAYYRHLE